MTKVVPNMVNIGDAFSSLNSNGLAVPIKIFNVDCYSGRDVN